MSAQRKLALAGNGYALRSLPSAALTPKAKLGVIALTGILSIIAAQLFLSIFIGQGAYEMSKLKFERADVTTQSDILSAEVDSLASNQNLANAAQSLGMIPNSSPVFLKLSDESIIGKPKAASFDPSHQVSRNLVPNAAMTTRSSWTAKTVSSTNVATAEVAPATVTLNPGDLPVSPTH